MYWLITMYLLVLGGIDETRANERTKGLRILTRRSKLNLKTNNMNEEIAQFLIDVFSTLADAGKRIGYGKFTYELEMHSGKEYVDIELSFEKGNAKFSDVALFYYKEGEFEPKEFIESLEGIIRKGVSFTA